MAEKIKKVEIIDIDEAISSSEEEATDGFPCIKEDPLNVILDNDLPDELRSKEAQELLKKIDAGIEEAEKGVTTYFHSSPKRAVEFQQNHIAYLELKAKILKLISSDNKSSPQQQLNQQNNIIIDEKTAGELKKKLISSLYAGKDS